MKRVWIHHLLLHLARIISSSAGTVENLTGTEGGSITFNHSVLVDGVLHYKERLIAMVAFGKHKILANYWKDKVHWNNTTGFFTITKLSVNDSGGYSVDAAQGDKAQYDLTVFAAVSPPSVSRVNVTTARCDLLCVVDTPPAATLWWYKDGRKLSASSSSQSLPLAIATEDFNSSYRCEADASYQAKSLVVSVTALCREDKEPETTSTSKSPADVTTIVLCIVFIVLPLAVLAGVLLIWKCFKKGQNTEDTHSKEPDVLYSDINVVNTSCQGRAARPTQTDDESNLKTVYAKLEVHNYRRDTTC